MLTLSKTGVLYETLNVVGKNCGLTVVIFKKIYFGHHILFFYFLADCIFLRLNSSLIASNLFSKGKIEIKRLK